MMHVRKITALTSGICITIYFIEIIQKPFLTRAHTHTRIHNRTETLEGWERAKNEWKKKNQIRFDWPDTWCKLVASCVHYSRIDIVYLFSFVMRALFILFTIEKSPLGRSNIVNSVRQRRSSSSSRRHHCRHNSVSHHKRTKNDGLMNDIVQTVLHVCRRTHGTA